MALRVTDKQVALQLLRERQNEMERERVGLIAPRSEREPPSNRFWTWSKSASRRKGRSVKTIGICGNCAASSRNWERNVDGAC